MTKKKLLVILGAGSSIACGMPSVTNIDEWMRQWSKEWQDVQFNPGALGPGIFNELWCSTYEYLQKNPRPQLNIHLNFEQVLGEMIALASWTAPSPFGNALGEAVENASISSRFRWHDPAPGPYFIQNLALDQFQFLLERLAGAMRKSSRMLNRGSAHFSNYRKIISRLRDEFDVGIYNLNYDTVAINSWPDSFNGFAGEEFDPQAIFRRVDWGFIYHLHGSVHHSLTGPFRNTVIWKNDLSDDFFDAANTLPNMMSDFKAIPPTSLIAGGFKLDQLLIDPFQSLYASLVRHTHEADAILIAGYGFSDVHVNRALQNRCDRFSGKPELRPPVIVITNNHKIGSTGMRDDLWSYQLKHTLNTQLQCENMALGPSIIDGLVEAGKLEEDTHGRVSIWHGGFTDAVTCLDRIIGHLVQ